MSYLRRITQLARHGPVSPRRAGGKRRDPVPSIPARGEAAVPLDQLSAAEAAPGHPAGLPEAPLDPTPPLQKPVPEQAASTPSPVPEMPAPSKSRHPPMVSDEHPVAAQVQRPRAIPDMERRASPVSPASLDQPDRLAETVARADVPKAVVPPAAKPPQTPAAEEVYVPEPVGTREGLPTPPPRLPLTPSPVRSQTDRVESVDGPSEVSLAPEPVEAAGAVPSPPEARFDLPRPPRPQVAVHIGTVSVDVTGDEPEVAEPGHPVNIAAPEPAPQPVSKRPRGVSGGIWSAHRDLSRHYLRGH